MGCYEDYRIRWVCKCWENNNFKKLIDNLKTQGFNLQESLIDIKSPKDLHATFKNGDNGDIIFIATGGDSASHVLNNINEAKRKGAKY